MSSRLSEVLELLRYEQVAELHIRSNLIHAILNFAELQQNDEMASQCRQEIAKLRTAAAWQSLK
nr:hypothetical protein D1p1_00075 [Serratia entomophila]ULG12379.1 hypothetical protein M3p_00083 [Serratia entomophila]ULG16031.1 hypothetical protein 591p_00181 [Serratia proteamaculans]ULG18415.1 hypothetical protein Man4p_00098 [Serratia proteamaculans]ULG19609.1 hypothetical protein S-prot-1p1_00024 [Serratia proteamaculans]